MLTGWLAVFAGNGSSVYVGQFLEEQLAQRILTMHSYKAHHPREEFWSILCTGIPLVPALK